MFKHLVKFLAAAITIWGITRKKSSSSTSLDAKPVNDDVSGPDSVTFIPSDTVPKDVNNNFTHDSDDVEIRSPG